MFFFSFAFCTFFNKFHVRLGKKSKSVSFSRVYVCVKAKLTVVSFFFTFFYFAPFPNANIFQAGMSVKNDREVGLYIWRRATISELFGFILRWVRWEGEGRLSGEMRQEDEVSGEEKKWKTPFSRNYFVKKCLLMNANVLKSGREQK